MGDPRLSSSNTRVCTYLALPAGQARLEGPFPRIWFDLHKASERLGEEVGCRDPSPWQAELYPTSDTPAGPGPSVEEGQLAPPRPLESCRENDTVHVGPAEATQAVRVPRGGSTQPRGAPQVSTEGVSPLGTWPGTGNPRLLTHTRATGAAGPAGWVCLRGGRGAQLTVILTSEAGQLGVTLSKSISRAWLRPRWEAQGGGDRGLRFQPLPPRPRLPDFTAGSQPPDICRSRIC